MSIYDGIPLATLSARLTEARDAYHALNTGKQAVSLGTGDKKITFTAADVDKLRSYIRELQSAIAVLSGNASSARPYSVATWTR